MGSDLVPRIWSIYCICVLTHCTVWIVELFGKIVSVTSSRYGPSTQIFWCICYWIPYLKFVEGQMYSRFIFKSERIVLAFDSQILYPKVESPILNYCYNVSGHAIVEFPTFSIVFVDGAIFTPLLENYFIEIDSNPMPILCLAMLEAPSSSPSILGNYLQQNTHFLYEPRLDVSGIIWWNSSYMFKNRCNQRLWSSKMGSEIDMVVQVLFYRVGVSGDTVSLSAWNKIKNIQNFFLQTQLRFKSYPITQLEIGIIPYRY